jgi:hypothetical protein
MHVSFDLRPTRLFLGVGALALAFAVGAAAASTGAPSRPATGPAAPAVAAAVDDATDASAALGLDADAALVAAVGVDRTTDDQPAAARLKGGAILRAIIGKTERAEITVSTAENGQKTILYVRGTFSAASTTSVTITLKDGTKQAFTIDTTTVVRSAGKAKAIADIPTTGRGLAVGVKNADGTYTAKFVRFAPAK